MISSVGTGNGSSVGMVMGSSIGGDSSDEPAPAPAGPETASVKREQDRLIMPKIVKNMNTNLLDDLFFLITLQS